MNTFMNQYPEFCSIGSASLLKPLKVNRSFIKKVNKRQSFLVSLYFLCTPLHGFAYYTQFKISSMLSINVTRSGKTDLIYTKYTCLYNDTYLLCYICYPKSVNFIEFLMDFCMYGNTLAMIQITDKKLLHFKLSKSCQILCVDKTCFPRPSHIYVCTTCSKLTLEQIKLTKKESQCNGTYLYTKVV